MTMNNEVSATHEDKHHRKINGEPVITETEEEENEEVQKSWRDYFELAKLLVGSGNGGFDSIPR